MSTTEFMDARGAADLINYGDTVAIRLQRCCNYFGEAIFAVLESVS